MLFFLLRFFEISQKRLKLFWLKKLAETISVYKKDLISKHRKNYIFRDNICFVKISVRKLVCVRVTKCFCRTSSKTRLNIKKKFYILILILALGPRFSFFTPQGPRFSFFDPTPRFFAVSFCIFCLLGAHWLCIQNLVEFRPRAYIFIFWPPSPILTPE